MADTPHDPRHERLGEFCYVHGEEYQDHDCDLVDDDEDSDEYRWKPAAEEPR
jgi:hypothetical protein